MARATHTPGQVLRKALPGRMQVQLHHYQRERRVFRPVPGHSLTVDVRTPAEARRLYAELRAVVDAGRWRDDFASGADDHGGDSVGTHGATAPALT